jgi:outer membrane immunogenic protein
MGGGQIGYNFQFGQLVVGPELDFQSFHLSGSRTAGAVYACCGSKSFSMTQNVSTDWLFTARARAGWAADKFLIYGTAGLAETNLKHESAFGDTFGAAEDVTDSATKTGWAAGAGVEYALTRNWTVKGEYLHVDFGSVSSTSNLGPSSVTGSSPTNPTNMFHNANLRADIARAGVNYKFGP